MKICIFLSLHISVSDRETESCRFWRREITKLSDRADIIAPTCPSMVSRSFPSPLRAAYGMQFRTNTAEQTQSHSERVQFRAQTSADWVFCYIWIQSKSEMIMNSVWLSIISNIPVFLFLLVLWSKMEGKCMMLSEKQLSTNHNKPLQINQSTPHQIKNAWIRLAFHSNYLNLYAWIRNTLSMWFDNSSTAVRAG